MIDLDLLEELLDALAEAMAPKAVAAMYGKAWSSEKEGERRQRTSSYYDRFREQYAAKRGYQPGPAQKRPIGKRLTGRPPGRPKTGQ